HDNRSDASHAQSSRTSRGMCFFGPFGAIGWPVEVTPGLTPELDCTVCGPSGENSPLDSVLFCCSPAAAAKAQRGDKRAEQGQADEWTAAEMGHDARSLHGRHNSKTSNQGEVRISLFPAFSAISAPACARFWARCRHSSRGF